jgi:hypothetical protein
LISPVQKGYSIWIEKMSVWKLKRPFDSPRFRREIDTEWVSWKWDVKKCRWLPWFSKPQGPHAAVDTPMNLRVSQHYDITSSAEWLWTAQGTPALQCQYSIQKFPDGPANFQVGNNIALVQRGILKLCAMRGICKRTETLITAGNYLQQNCK